MRLIAVIFILLYWCAVSAQSVFGVSPVERHAGADVCRAGQEVKTHRDTLYSYVNFRQAHSQLDTMFADNSVRLSLPPVVTAAPDTLSAPVTDSVPESKKDCDYTFLLKTNMLYDAVLTPNIGVEFPIGERVSVEADWMYARWSKASAHKYWRIYGGDLSIYARLGKPAPGRDRFAGHFLGVYGQTVVYDFQFGDREGVLSDKWNYAAGIAYKYSFPIKRRLYIECSLGVGYMGGVYKRHRPIDDCDVWLSTHRLHWFGPTRAGVSLVWKIGVKKHDKKGKGGRR